MKEGSRSLPYIILAQASKTEEEEEEEEEEERRNAANRTPV
jgi:hypothetical protein